MLVFVVLLLLLSFPDIEGKAGKLLGTRVCQSIRDLYTGEERDVCQVGMGYDGAYAYAMGKCALFPHYEYVNHI
ncbi:hypothetical protein CRM22_007975 [Opisthorchis felineus]|uniref:Uncharacterized protein n=1 Tax=Opisthorchis felineus TaxID=147828 RepID=A0A4S2LE00_OPIFE|nr:hypothetical protein CRM22_007975 [Opisthorchis felineus]